MYFQTAAEIRTINMSKHSQASLHSVTVPVSVNTPVHHQCTGGSLYLNWDLFCSVNQAVLKRPSVLLVMRTGLFVFIVNDFFLLTFHQQQEPTISTLTKSSHS
ncbi:hypothetical protein GOODEAATRI_031490 [Goodea atripinnis]|uniref:Uncharacterized protein n=1 Tax=Goodea atripinnis TaxID=208336 RepID=A0ABV0MWQ9_9TELE